MPSLLVNPHSPEARKIELKPGTNSLGRSEANDFALDDPSVSSSHCQIVVENGNAVIRDLDSTNGTYVNHAPVREAALRTGQTVHLGTLELMFYADAPACAGAAQPAATHQPVAGAPPVPPPRVTAPAGVARGQPAATSAAVPIPQSPVGGHPPPPAPAPLVSVEPIDAGPQFCKFHPKTPARFVCDQCQHFFCELCINTRGQQKFCRTCGVGCLPVRVQIRFPPPPKGFYARLPGAFVYPFRGSGVLVLIAGTILLAIVNAWSGMSSFGMRARTGPGFRSGMSFGWWGMMAQVIVVGYLFTYMQSIIHSTAVEEVEMPSLPNLTNFWEDIVLPCLQLIGVTLISFAPAIGVGLWVVATQQESAGVLLISVFALGGFYFPMAFLAAALLDSVAAANPLQVIPSIFKVPLEYLVAVIALAGVLGIRALGDLMLVQLFPRGLATHSTTKLLGMLGAQAFWSLVSLYLLTVGMRILGLLYVSKKDKLGWYDR
jgi:hypothetical protein